MNPLSKYYQQLGSEDQKRYKEKISVIQVDPYVISKDQWSDDVHNFPTVTYPDIVTYFLLTKSRYTADDLKAYKSLEAYNQFVSGWVRNLTVAKPSKEAPKVICARVSYGSGF